MGKTAVILFNLGGPDSQEAIYPFLKNFFMDPNIIAAPKPVRALVSEMIARRRSKNEAGASYGLLGGRSPLLENTEAQALALERALKAIKADREWKTFICMRYWHPMSELVCKSVKAWAPEEIVLLPLYPQYSTTTTRSSFQDWFRAADRAGLDAPTQAVCCYPFDDGFIRASANLVRDTHDLFRKQNKGKAPRVLFSAHGLPEKIIRKGDPYQWQCEESARRIAEATGIPDLDWMICYQSRVGPLKWIGPSTEEALHKAAMDKIPVLVYPHAFVSEHVETLVEIEIEYRAEAEKLGVPGFVRIPTVSVHEAFIGGLAHLIAEEKATSGRICPARYSRCCQQDKEFQTRQIKTG